jgi:hypothetical protein
MRVRFGLHSGVNDKQGTCVSSVFNPHTGLQQCYTCNTPGYGGMQCPASHPVCCFDQRCVQNATQCTCINNLQCPLGTCCTGNLRASLIAPNPEDSGTFSCICPVPTCIVLSCAEGMPSMPLDHDCLIIFYSHALLGHNRRSWNRPGNRNLLAQIGLCACGLDCIQVSMGTVSRARACPACSIPTRACSSVLPAATWDM